MKIALFIIACFSCSQFIAQEDSIYISVFVTPLEEIVIDDQDSLLLVNEPLSTSEDLTYKYDFFIVGFDTLTTTSFTASFSTADGIEISESFSMTDIETDPEINRYGDSVILPLGTYGYMNIYEFEISVYGLNEELILTLSDFYDAEE